MARLTQRVRRCALQALKEEGYRIYTDKPTLKSAANVTWSDEEYGHPGLHHMYLRYKSFQRFTETYALLERAEARGLFSRDGAFQPKRDGRPLRVASIGGGPG